MAWLGAAAAPWATGLGLLIALTVPAGTGSGSGPSLALGRIGQIASVPPRRGAPTGPTRYGLDGHLLDVSAAEPLRGGIRRQAHPAPAGGRGRDASGASVWLANAGETVTGILSPGSAAWSPDQEPTGFVPVPDLGLGRPDGAVNAADTPGGDDAFEASDGATPAVPKAVALSSVTPAPADAVPVEVAVSSLGSSLGSSLALPGYSPRLDRGAGPESEPQPDAAPRYAGLIAPESMEREQRCLAEAVYFEARSEPEEGQAAVAQVVLNRVKSGLYPASVCGVVYQNRHRYMGCQFSFACEGKALRITDAASWASATRVAGAVIEGRTYLSEVGGATHYHADYVRPGWSRRLRKMDVIGRHIFYQLKRGQT